MKTTNDYVRLTVRVPRTENRRFRTIAKALGCEIEKRNALDEALDDVMAGRVYKVESIDEFRKIFA